MFLHFLTENTEKIFFLKFAYLLAVAEKEDNSENIPIRDLPENPEEGKYEFQEFAPGFSMQISELVILRKFAEEMGMRWAPVSSYMSDLNIWGWHQDTTSLDAVEKIARENSVADMLHVAMKELNHTEDRSAILNVVLEAIFAQTNATSFVIEKKKSILMEAVAMAYADGSISKYEQELLVYFCELCRLDKDLIEDFKEITMEFSKIYAQSLELITE